MHQRATRSEFHHVFSLPHVLAQGTRRHTVGLCAEAEEDEGWRSPENKRYGAIRIYKNLERGWP